jgi:hypothetical protein
MSTRANPMAGRYFNDPGIAAAVSNLAGAFAPPSPEEYLLAEQVKGARTTNSALADLYAQAGGDFDKLGVVADLYDPSNSYHSVGVESADRRYNTDSVAATSRANNRDTGLFGLAGTVLTGDEAMVGLPPEVAAAIGVPEFAPVAGQDIGAPASPLSETEMIAQIMAQQSPEDQRALLDPSVVQTAGPDGQPVYTPEMDAIGMEAYNNPGGQAAADLVSYRTADGREGTAIFDPNTQTLVDASTKQPLPAGAQTYKLQGGDKALMTGGTNSNQTLFDRITATTVESDMLIDSLATEIQGQAGAAGLAGTIQSVGQNLLQVGQELGAAFGGDPNAIVSQEDLASLGMPTGPYDQTFARIRSGMLQLAYLNAQRDNPSGEVSRFSLERQIEALGQGMLANDQSILAALGMNKEANARKRAAANALIGQEVVPPGAPPAGGATGATDELTEEDLQYLGAP